MIVRRLIITVPLAYCILANGPALNGQDSVLTEPIRLGLAEYANLDPLAVTMTVTVEATPLGRQKIAGNVLDRISGAQIQQVAIRQGRIYVRREPKTVDLGKSNAVMAETAFDRKVIYFGDPKRGILNKWLPGNDKPAASYFSLDYFRAAGIRLPTRMRDVVLPWSPQSEITALLSEGGRVQTTRSTNLEGLAVIYVQLKAKDPSKELPPVDLAAGEAELRRPGRSLSEEEIQRQLREARERQAAGPPQRLFEFYLDPARGYAVRRLDTRDEDGRLLMRCDCTEPEQLTGRNVWLPRRCREENYAFEELPNEVFKSPLFIRHFDATEFDLKPWPYERFELNYTKPGTHVNDATFPEVKGISGVNYKVPATPKQLDQTIEAARQKYQSQRDTETWSSVLQWLFLSLNVVLLAGLAVFVHRRRQKAANPPTHKK
jgi:hypothetical protein